MNPKELRLDNLIKYQDLIVRVKSISEDKLVVEELRNKDCFTVGIEQVEGIELTPKLLTKKCGFRYWNGDTQNVHTDAWSGGARWDIDFMSKEPHPIHLKSRYAPDELIKHLQSLPHIRFLNDLQNLYFSLTNTELEVRL